MSTSNAKHVHLVDVTCELFRCHYALSNRSLATGATRGVLASMLDLVESGATHIGGAEQHAGVDQQHSVAEAVGQQLVDVPGGVARRRGAEGDETRWSRCGSPVGRQVLGEGRQQVGHRRAAAGRLGLEPGGHLRRQLDGGHGDQRTAVIRFPGERVRGCQNGGTYERVGAGPHACDTRTVTGVADALMHGTSADSTDDTPSVRRVLVNPTEVTPNDSIPDGVWDKLLSLPSQSLPQRTAKPVKRLTALAHELAVDGLIPDAGKRAHAELHKVLDAAQARYATEIATARSSVLTVEGKTLTADLASGTKTFDQFVAEADHVVIEYAYRRAARVLSPDVARSYAERLADADEYADSIDGALLDAHATVAAFGLVSDVKDYLDDEADKLARKWLTEHRAAIKALSDERQDVYRQLREMSVEPQDLDLAKPTAWLVPTTERRCGTDTDLPPYRMHLLADRVGSFPADLNEWEAEVLDREYGRPGFVGWYRNPSRRSQDSLAVAYEHGGRIRTVRPDFLFFSEHDDGTIGAAIVDPHGHHLADALPKLRGLAAYAERHGADFERIDAVTKLNGIYRVLDFTEASVRDAVDEATDAAVLYGGDHATDYLTPPM